MATSETTERATALFHALADPTRLDILAELRAGEQCVCVLAERFETGQSRLSFHMKTLREAGLVTDRRQGRWIYYALNQDALEEAATLIASLRASRRKPT
ncbi:MAG: winged helix-turn-helix transcriptional regulator [Candidatus Rokubacteria bacterium]|nr:winged helix-turn-helix transcriptional regulator [Candidatus Rokubacteria bacterium]